MPVGCCVLRAFFELKKWLSKEKNMFNKDKAIAALLIAFVSVCSCSILHAEERPSQAKYDEYLDQCNKFFRPDGKACWSLGMILDERAGAGVKAGDERQKIREKAISYFVKSCELNYGRGCNSVAKRIKSKNKKEADRYYDKAKKLGEEYRVMANRGIDAHKNGDLKTASELFDKACNGNLGFGCRNKAIMFFNENKDKEGYALLVEACKKGDALSCYGASLDKSADFAIKAEENCYKDVNCSSELMVDICKKLESNNEYFHSTKLAKFGCDHLSGEACSIYARNSELGKGIRKNMEIAKKYYGIACDLGDSYGCDSFARLSE